MVSDPADDPWSSDPAHGEGLANPLLTQLPEWVDLDLDGPAWRAEWRCGAYAERTHVAGRSQTSALGQSLLMCLRLWLPQSLPIEV
ncbi:hypothetical protein V5E97_26735 [Singulisphaera sp. Ch08]|uniref:Uncharacterized protein n=1 Tax=Singulisphaera sp. Ch08 TaxID=3120278 RepID=A0AAU7C934_9BACT